ncbi:uncharacterized protein LOC101763757 [Setaria italica]|uniref:uncharacterized protein LOC101763757 n=1 Tax=Setaria italica TaxID=4555 RepID=UPI000350A237|nr:uncharacterized protein LOC101763757 [Setaria italica]
MCQSSSFSTTWYKPRSRWLFRLSPVFVFLFVVVSSPLAWLAGRVADQAPDPDRPRIHQPWPTLRLLEVISSAVRRTTRTISNQLLPMDRTQGALLGTMGSSNHRRLVTRRKPASSATYFHASPAAERRASCGLRA